MKAVIAGFLFLVASTASIAVECPGNTEPNNFRTYIFSQYYYGTTCSGACGSVPEYSGKTCTITNPTPSPGAACGNLKVCTSESCNFFSTAFIYYNTNYNGGCGCPENSDQIVNSTGDPVWCSTPADPLDDLSNCQDSWSVASGDCGSYPEDCAAAGGTFGWFNGEPVCLPGQGEQDAPVCGVDIVCNDPIPSTDIGSASSIDDPNAPQAPASDTTNQTQAGSGSVPGTDSVSGEPCDASQGGTCIANDTNGDGVCDPATEPNCVEKQESARGECDPESSDYQSCVGLLENDPGIEQYSKTAMNAARDNAVGKWEQIAGASLASETSLDVDAQGLADKVVGIMPTSITCSDVVMMIQGHELRLSCEKLAPLRQILGWALYVLAAYTIVGLFWVRPGA